MIPCPFGGDGEFSFRRFADAYNSGLADTLGNTFSRSVSMAVRYFDGDLGDVSAVDRSEWLGGLDLDSLVDALRGLIGTFQYNLALQRIWGEVLVPANRYIQTTEPFKVVKVDKERTRVILANCAEAIRVVGILIKPFLPATAETFYRAFSAADSAAWDAVSYADVLKRPTAAPLKVTAPLVAGKPAPLFPKIEEKAV